MKYIIIGLLSGLIMLMCYITFISNTRYNKQLAEAAYWRAQNFKVDTVYSTTKFSDTKFYPEKQETVPPQTTTIYQSEVPQGYIDFQNKVLAYIDSNKRDTVKISHSFLSLYPRNPKFLGGRFRKDTVSLDLLGLDGVIRTDVFPVNYSVLKYDYYDNLMHASEIKTSNIKNGAKTKFFQYNGTYLSYKHDFLNPNKQLELTSDVNLWKVRLGGFVQTPTDINLNKIQAGAKVGIRLF